MGILTRFSDIIAANINALLDKAENPAKMIDQYQRKLASDLADVKRETAGVMAEESRSKRLVEENEKEVAKYVELARKALLAQNDADARVFLSKKQEFEAIGASLNLTYAVAHDNATKMRQMHDKLVKDINALGSRAAVIKAKTAAAKTMEQINKISTTSSKSEGALNAFERMEEKANRALDEAGAYAELSSEPIDAAQALEVKYHSRDIDMAVEDELAAMKESLVGE